MLARIMIAKSMIAKISKVWLQKLAKYDCKNFQISFFFSSIYEDIC